VIVARKLDQVVNHSHAAIGNRIESIGHTIRLLVAQLRLVGFEFDHPDDVLPGVAPDLESSIERIEREIGRVPYAVATFWRKIGSVDLTGAHPAWNGCVYPDALVVFPASAAIDELHDVVDERKCCPLDKFPYRIPIAPDYFHKSNTSGGMWYNVACPAPSDNPIVDDEPHCLPFLEYLEMTLSWAGFPGLANSPFHKWPIDTLRAALRPNS
jgi:hypothetical protein